MFGGTDFVRVTHVDVCYPGPQSWDVITRRRGLISYKRLKSQATFKSRKRSVSTSTRYISGWLPVGNRND